MRRYRKWALTLGLMAATSGVAQAGPFSFFKSKKKTKPAAATRSASSSTRTSSSGRTANQKMAEHIAGALRTSRLNGSDIEIEYRGGLAVLKGSVSDANQKARATQVVSRLRGVDRVDNRLQVAGRTAPSSRTPSAPTRRPLDIRRTGGGVRQAGLESVVNESITESTDLPKPAPVPSSVKASQPSPAKASNQQIAQLIANALTAERFSGYDIEIRFQNGTALLAGKVTDPSQKIRATQITSSLPHVKSVTNQLQVIQPSGPAYYYSGQASAAPYARHAAAGPYSGRPVLSNPYAQQQQHYMPINYQPGAAGQPGMPPGYGPGAGPGGPPPGYGPGPGGGMPPTPPGYAHGGAGASHAAYNMPRLPNYAWPSYASYPNAAQVSYPKEYSASAWPYIGPFYPYPQIPLGW
ncbi:MAG: BON domain-containing protein, partial [Planctomycetaceae bacterium]